MMNYPSKLIQSSIKIASDRFFATLALLILSPILLLTGVIVFLTMGSPVLFTQPRPGKRGHLFQFYKFRTMKNDVDENGNLLPDKERLTRVGQFLRKTSLDELPQLWNVCKGDMSFVGPRPLLVRYLDRYTPEQARRHEVLPGITGWAQVNGRNNLDWNKKFELDVFYVDNWSLWVDIKILFLTLWKVLRKEGINQPGSATMEEFKGYNLKNNNELA